jgi:hypothetical protein
MPHYHTIKVNGAGATMGSAKDRLDYIVKLRPSILP